MQDPRIASMMDIARQSAVGVEADDLAGLVLDAAIPNPVRSTARIAFSLARPAPVTLEVVDVLGRTVAVLAEGPHAAGVHGVTFDASGLTSGVYVCRLRTPDGAVSRTLVRL